MRHVSYLRNVLDGPYKRHETHTRSLTHSQEVIYLPGLEIRTRDNGEELHVITLPSGHSSVRCLHWVTGKPVNIAADQVRYSLDDHLGSCALELDQQAQVISEEGYYPFGATAWYARGSEVDVDYKTVRYSGKEMDDSGLYYYGALLRAVVAALGQCRSGGGCGWAEPVRDGRQQPASVRRQVGHIQSGV